MSGPWERYSAPPQTEDGPWSRFQTAPEQPQAQPPASDAPWYAKLGSAADDIVRLAANAATLGAADKFAAYMSGAGEQAERARTQGAADRAGWAGTVAEIGGAMLPAGAAVGAGAAAARAIAPNVAANAGLALRTAGLAGVGAGLGGAEAAVRGEDALTGAAIGGAAGGVGALAGEAISRGIGKAAGAFNKQPKIPDIAELNTAKSAAYKAADDAGIIFTPSASDRVRQSVVRSLTDIGYDPALQPGATPAVRRLLDLEGKNITFTGLDTVRKIASNGYIPGNKSNNKAVSEIIRAIDDVTANPRASDVLTGNATEAGKAISEARSLAHRAAKAEQLEYAVQSAKNRAGTSGSGGNVDNATAQNIRKMLERGRGFTPDEKAVMQQIVTRTPGQDALRLVGKLSPSGSGLMAALGVGATAVNPAMAIPAGIGIGAKMLSDRGTSSAVDELSRIIRAGGSRAATQAPPNAVQRLAQSEKERLMRLIMSGGLVAAN